MTCPWNGSRSIDQSSADRLFLRVRLVVPSKRIRRSRIQLSGTDSRVGDDGRHAAASCYMRGEEARLGISLHAEDHGDFPCDTRCLTGGQRLRVVGTSLAHNHESAGTPGPTAWRCSRRTRVSHLVISPLSVAVLREAPSDDTRNSVPAGQPGASTVCSSSVEEKPAEKESVRSVPATDPPVAGTATTRTGTGLSSELTTWTGAEPC